MNALPLAVGAKVIHVPLRAKATVLGAINLGDPDDLRLQGIRYIVQHSGWTWSVPERFLQVDDSIPL